MRRSVTLVLGVMVASCATPADVRYTATYANIGPNQVALLAAEATAQAGYEIAKAQLRTHDLAFLTLPTRLDPADHVDVAFLVQVVYAVKTAQKKRFTVVVEPRAYEDDRRVPEDQLPPSARPRARALSDAIRAHARRYEAPP